MSVGEDAQNPLSNESGAGAVSSVHVPHVIALPGVQAGHVGPPPVPVVTDELTALLASEDDTDVDIAPPAPPVPIAPPAPVVASEELAETDAASDEDEASAEEEASALDDASDDEALVEPMPPIPPAPVVATELLASVEDAELASEELSEELMDDVEAALDEDCVEDVATEEPIPVVAIVPPAPPCGGQPMFDSRQTFPLDVAVDVGVTPSSQAEQRIANASGVAKEVRRFLRISYSCN